jgi:hypothetical protein
MKYLIIALMAIATLQMTSCKETDGLKNAATNEKMKDSLNKLYPSLLQGHVNIEVHDFKDVTVLLGDKELFAKSDEELKAISANIAEITYQLYHENNYLDNGKVTFVSVEDRMPTDTDPKKEYDMHLADVVKANEK